MPPRVALWSSSFAFGMEAVANEVQALHENLPQSFIWGINPRQAFIYKPKKYFATSARYQLGFRLFTKLFQNRYDIQHLYGSLGDWFHFRALNQQPALLTIALDSNPVEESLRNKINHFAVEWPSAIEKLKSLGIAEEKITLVLPPVDLNKFTPTLAPADKFIATFASSPEKIEAIDARGIPLMLDAAKLKPEMHFKFKWRNWGESLSTVQELIKSQNLGNVTLDTSLTENMAQVYQTSHVTLACFTDLSQCKPMPNSIIESLACARPVIVTRSLELAPMIEEANAGIVIDEDADQLAQALTTIQSDWDTYSKNARKLAEDKFCQQRFINQYLDIYENLTASTN